MIVILQYCMTVCQYELLRAKFAKISGGAGGRFWTEMRNSACSIGSRIGEIDMVALIADLEALTLCSGGPVGGKAHSRDECLDLTSIAPARGRWR